VEKVYIPLKVSPGQLAVDFDPSKIDVMINLPDGAYVKINSGKSPEDKTGSPVDLTELGVDSSQSVVANIYIIQGDDDTVLEPGEKFLLVISGLSLQQYDKFTVEIRPLQGAPLVIERTVPPTLSAGSFVNLG
ncbi:MAG: flagellin, partial [Thermosphaera sp.]